MEDISTVTTASKLSVAEIMAKPKAKKVPSTSTFQVRLGTVGICNRFAGGDATAGCLFNALLELWVNSKVKIRRPHGDGMRDYLFLSLDDLVDLTCLRRRAIEDRAVQRLRATSYFEIEVGRVERSGPNKYRVYFDERAFWDEFVAQGNLDCGPGSEIDRSKLPHLFQRLYDRVHGA